MTRRGLPTALEYNDGHPYPPVYNLDNTWTKAVQRR